jgi:hypothetical protein
MSEIPPAAGGVRQKVGWMGGEYDRDHDEWHALPLAQRIVALVSVLRIQDTPDWHAAAVKQVEKELQDAAPAPLPALPDPLAEALDEIDTLCQAIEGARAGALSSKGLWHYHEKARTVLARLTAPFPVYRCEEWQCRHVFTDGRCCALPKDHTGQHAPRSENEPSDIIAWLNLEQKRAERWFRPGSGVNRFALTGPELMRIRLALEIAARLTARPAQEP